MERVGGQRKRPKVWQIPAVPRYQSTCDSPSKIGFERRRLSLRSENTAIAETGKIATATTPQSSSSSKQPGKENESPFGIQDYKDKFRAKVPIAKSTIKRKKPSNSSYITNSEKKIIRRRLSGDYEDRLASKNLFAPIFAAQPKQPDSDNRHDAMVRFSVYDDGGENTERTFRTTELYQPEVIPGKDLKRKNERIESRGAGTPYCQILENDPSTAPRDLYFLWKSYHRRYKSREDADRPISVPKSAEEEVKCIESSATQLRAKNPEFLDSRASQDQDISDVEFLIERVDRNDDRTPAMNRYRKVKSASDIGRLNVPLRRGEDISPLKRRINQLKKSAIIVGKSFGIEKTARRKYPAVVTTGDGRTSTTKTSGPEGTSHPLPIADAKKETNRKIGSDEKPLAIDPGLEISGLHHENPWRIQYATDYTEESIDLEDIRGEYSYKISKTFLKEKSVTPEQRRIVVNFLISVHAYLFTSSTTLCQATKIFDAILDIKDVSVKELQLVALAASWIAIKNMETIIPTAGEMISFAKDLYYVEGPNLLCKCERKILKTLGFNIRFSDPFYISAYYLQRLSSLGTASIESSILKAIHHSAGYLMDVALLDENYSGIRSGLLAAAATRTAVHLVLDKSWEDLVKNSPWNNERSTRYRYTQEEINRVAGQLVDGVLESAEKDSPTGAVYKKYKNARYGNISDYLVTKMKKLAELMNSKQD